MKDCRGTELVIGDTVAYARLGYGGRGRDALIRLATGKIVRFTKAMIMLDDFDDPTRKYPEQVIKLCADR